MSDTTKAVTEALQTAADILTDIPTRVWVALIILCGYGLAAFAIYAVLSVSKVGQ